jgi:hypothetical protein
MRPEERDVFEHRPVRGKGGRAAWYIEEETREVPRLEQGQQGRGTWDTVIGVHALSSLCYQVPQSLGTSPTELGNI